MRDPRWQLASINAEQPSPKQLKAYLKERQEEELENGDQTGLGEMIEPNSLALIDNGLQVDKYSFKAIVGDDNELGDELLGELWHNKQNNFIERFDFYTTKPFSPATGFKINSLRISMKFKQIEPDIFAFESVDTKMSGKAFLVKLGDPPALLERQ